MAISPVSVGSSGSRLQLGSAGAPSPAAALPTPTPAGPVPDGALQSHYAGLPGGLSPSTLAFVRAQQATGAAAIGTDPAVEATLDDLQRRYAGGYVVDGRPAQAAPMFRMNGGFNGKLARQHEPILRALCQKHHLGGVGMCLVGRGTPEQLVRITQMLIDEGHLPGGDGPASARIRQMQWQFGLGLDCVGFTWQAAKDVHGASAARALPEGQRANSLPTRLHGHFVQKPAHDARPGDVINLVNVNPREPGHNVIVRRNQPLDGTLQRQLSQRSPEARLWLLDVGPIQVLTVDSSWGAGPEGGSYGGVRTDVWMYNARAREWASFDPKNGALEISKVGPQGERPTGAYRPRGAA